MGETRAYQVKRHKQMLTFPQQPSFFHAGPFAYLSVCLSVSPLLCLLESNLRLNGHPLYPALPLRLPSPASPIHHTTTRTRTLPLRGPLNQALHMPDPHLLSPPLLQPPSPLPISCSHSGFCCRRRRRCYWWCCCGCPTLPSATKTTESERRSAGAGKKLEEKTKKKEGERG